MLGLNAANARWIRLTVSLASGALGVAKAYQTRTGTSYVRHASFGSMAMSLPAGEPAAGSWQAVRTSELRQLVAAATRVPGGRPRVLAVDGRGGSGKSTLAERLRREATRSALLHTDDLAWHEPLFGGATCWPGR